MIITNTKSKKFAEEASVIIEGTIIKNRHEYTGRKMFVYLGTSDSLRHIEQEVPKPETVQQLITAILSKGYEVNTQTHHQVFIDYSGHVNQLSLRVYTGGNCNDKEEPEVSHRCYIDYGESSRDQLRKMYEVISNLL